MKTASTSLYLHVLLTPIGSSRMFILKIFENLGLAHKESECFNIMCILASLFFLFMVFASGTISKRERGTVFLHSLCIYLVCLATFGTRPKRI